MQSKLISESDMSIMQNVHGHELINLIAQQNRALSIEEIKELAVKNIGENVSFSTCSESSMDLNTMMKFLLDRFKLVEKDGGYVINFGNVCDHD